MADGETVGWEGSIEATELVKIPFCVDGQSVESFGSLPEDEKRWLIFRDRDEAIKGLARLKEVAEGGKSIMAGEYIGGWDFALSTAGIKEGTMTFGTLPEA